MKSLRPAFQSLLMLIALCSASCSSKSSPAGGSDAGAASDGPAKTMDCSGCNSAQVCVEGQCQDVPQNCPCPVETYCDLASNTCKIGCTEDSECSSGRICDANTRLCHTGCRMDSACAAGQICDMNSLLCRAGCRTDSACTTGQICDMNSLTCRAGCRSDAQCPAAGTICDMNTLTCQTGCRMDSECPMGEICDNGTLTCRAGCRSSATCAKETVCNPATDQCVPGCTADTGCNAGRICVTGMCTAGCRTSTTCPIGDYCNTGTLKCAAGCNGDTSRCAVGQACVSYVNGTYACSAACADNPCNGTGWQCLDIGGNYTGAECRLSCSSNAECPTGQVCTQFTTDPTVPSDFAVNYCSKPCSTAGGCAAAEDGYAMTGNCTCAANGLCQTTGADSYTCFQVSANYGL